MKPQIQLTLKQINEIKTDWRIREIHSICANSSLIVICADGLMRSIAACDNSLEWLDSYPHE